MNKQYETKDDVHNRIWADRDLSKVTKILPKEEFSQSIEEASLRVAVYCRVSTDRVSQAVSFNLQKRYYVKYVKSHPNWKLIGLYSDEGKSATTVKRRDGLLMMLKDAADGKFDLIVVKSISRLCRNLGDSIRIIKELKSLPRPIGIYFESEQMYTLDPNMDFVINILAMVAEGESKKKSEYTTASYRQRYSEGMYTVPASLGYRKVGVNQIDIDKDEAETVKLIYDMYLAEFDPKEIAETLMELKRKTHTHQYVDGRIKEGEVTWSESSVLNVLENEKRCGDVLAQKTYTVDYSEHLVKKNNRNVTQYYAVDQHPAIISRDDFYLALKIKRANKGGWKNGLQVIKTYVSGTLKGYVVTIPGWYGFGVSDYLRASLKAYNVDIPEETLYPYYVCSSSNEPSSEDEPSEIEHFHAITEEELEEDQELSMEEYKVFNEEVPSYLPALTELRAELRRDMGNDNKEKGIPVSARLFSTSEKPVATIDKRGIKFNSNCYERLSQRIDRVIKYIKLLWNPVSNMLLVGEADDNDPDTVKLQWVTYDENGYKMRRCSAHSLFEVIYRYMGWNPANKYKLYGEVVETINGKYIAFETVDPVVRVSFKKNMTSEKEKKGKDKIDIAVEDAKNTAAFYEDELDEFAEYLACKGTGRSKAVFFSDSENDAEKPDDECNQYDPEYVKKLVMEGTIPDGGWKYLDGMVEWNKNGFEMMSESWNGQMCSIRHRVDKSLQDERASSRNFGWPLNYTYPEKKDVLSEIDRLRKELTSDSE